LGLDCCF